MNEATQEGMLFGNNKAVVDGFIANLLNQANELAHHTIDARQQQNEMFNQRMRLVDEMIAANATNHRLSNNQGVNLESTNQILARKELDSGPTEAAMAAMSAAQGQKVQDSGAATSVAQITAVLAAIENRLAQLENKGS